LPAAGERTARMNKHESSQRRARTQPRARARSQLVAHSPCA